MATSSETVIVGGGHAGLALSYHLGRLGRPHVILERGRVAERWRSERWDSLMFQFPNWSLRLPGQDYRGDDPDGFATRDEVIAFIERYRELVAAPVRTGVRVDRVRPMDGGFRLETTDGDVTAANVVVATGPYQEPILPAVRHALPSDPGPGARERLSQSGAAPGRRGAGGGLRRLRLPDRGGPARRGRGPSTSRWAVTDAIRAATGATTCSGGWTASARWTRRSTSGPTRASSRTRSSPGSAAATRSTCATTPPPASRCSGTCGTPRARGSTWPTISRRCWPRATRASASSRARWTPTSRGPGSRLRRRAAVPGPLAESGPRRRSASSIWPHRASCRWSGPPASGATSGGSTRPSSTSGASRSTGAASPACAGLYFLGLPWLHKLKSSVLCGVGDDAAHLADHIAAGAARPRPGLIRRA